LASAQGKIKEVLWRFEITYPEISKEMKQMERMLPKSMEEVCFLLFLKNDTNAQK